MSPTKCMLSRQSCKLKADCARNGSEMERLLADNRLAREILGWEPHVGLEDGLKRTIEWIKQNEEKYRSGFYVV